MMNVLIDGAPAERGIDSVPVQNLMPKTSVTPIGRKLPPIDNYATNSCVVEDQSNVWVCKICKNTYYKKSKLDTHFRVHTGEVGRLSYILACTLCVYVYTS